jgi:hypothetical protein
MRKICLVALLVPALAAAQPHSADEWYKEGETQFNLGNFDKAIDAFKQGFSLETSDSKKAAYLYNIAQSYRQGGDCKNALFFYKRFLVLKDSDTSKPLAPKMRKDVEDRIAELDACVQQAASISKKPPNNNIPPGGDGTDKTGTADSHAAPPKDTAAVTPKETDGEDDAVSVRAAVVAPHLISIRATGGGTKLNTGDVDVPVQFVGALTVGYPIQINDKLAVEVGAAGTFTPVPYTNTAENGGKSGTSTLFSVMANGAVSYEVFPKAAVRVDVGLGALFFGGVSETPFTAQNETSGALSMFHVRAALSGDYAFTPNVFGTLTPIAFSYSPAKDGLDDSIKSITSIDFMVGIGYRM